MKKSPCLLYHFCCHCYIYFFFLICKYAVEWFVAVHIYFALGRQCFVWFQLFPWLLKELIWLFFTEWFCLFYGVPILYFYSAPFIFSCKDILFKGTYNSFSNSDIAKYNPKLNFIQIYDTYGLHANCYCILQETAPTSDGTISFAANLILGLASPALDEIVRILRLYRT